MQRQQNKATRHFQNQTGKMHFLHFFLSCMREFMVKLNLSYTRIWALSVLSFCCSLSSTPRSSRVEVSPEISWPAATDRSRRRMILPERVLGNESVKRISLDERSHRFPCTTCCFSCLLSSSLGRDSKVTKATMSSPLTSSGLLTTASRQQLGGNQSWLKLHRP